MKTTLRLKALHKLTGQSKVKRPQAWPSSSRRRKQKLCRTLQIAKKNSRVGGQIQFLAKKTSKTYGKKMSTFRERLIPPLQTPTRLGTTIKPMQQALSWMLSTIKPCLAFRVRQQIRLESQKSRTTVGNPTIMRNRNMAIRRKKVRAIKINIVNTKIISPASTPNEARSLTSTCWIRRLLLIKEV